MSHDVVAATQQLADVLALENTALAALDLATAASLLERKQAATTAFTTAQRGAVAVRTTIDTKALRAAAVRLREVTEQNRRLLERAIGVQNRVLGILASAARASNPTPRYGRSGAYAARPTSGWALTSSA